MRKQKRESTIINEDYSKRCSAKINLFLDIIGKRPDGFHELRSLFGEISLGDNILFKLTENPQIQISCTINDHLSDTSQSIPNHDNLVFKIAHYLQKTCSVKKGLTIILKKNIPISAGLGGGSSDAAQTILACNKLWNLNFSFKQMDEVALKFGSDISYFLKGGTSSVFGRGETVKQFSTQLKIKNILLVNPKIYISSKDAYSWFQSVSEKTRDFANIKKGFLTKNLNMVCNHLYNSLESGVFTHYPEIEKIKKKLIELGAKGSLMSGSGSTVFGIFDTEEIMESALSYFKNLKCWTKKTSLQSS